MKEFLNFLKETPTAFHAAWKIKEILRAAGFVELSEKKKWQLKPGGKYFVGRNMSSLCAFTIPKQDAVSFNITAAHLDSPTFKLKPNFELHRSKYSVLNTEVYGGPIYSTWMDRPLGIAGRVLVDTDEGVCAKLVYLDRPLAVIPNLPIHYNRRVNEGVSLNPQTDLLPLFSTNGGASLKRLLAEELKTDESSLLSGDLYLVVLDRGTLLGPNEEWIMAPQIDNLECSYALVQALLQADNQTAINVAVLFDNEEIGSSTMQGAGGTFLADTLERIALAIGKTKEEYLCLLSNSFLISADNAQGYHPNYPSKYDENNACYLNEGIVIKNAAKGSYTTSALSSAYFQKICQKAGVNYQLNANRSDIVGGSTLGAISVSQVSIPSVDIGLAQLAMHSAVETAGSADLKSLILAVKSFYSHTLTPSDEEKLNF